MNIIEIQDLDKSFKNICLFHNLTINFQKGKIYGLTGPNGSGKSVLFKLIAGFIFPDSGKIKINGNELNTEHRFPTDFGVLINKPGYLAELSGFKNLKFLAMINNKITDSEIKQNMLNLGLDPNLDTKVKDYSLGMKQKLGLCQAIMENQSVLLLDEPFNALDKTSVQTIRELLVKLNNEGKTIILTSHNQADIDILCHEVYEIDNYMLNLIEKN